MLTNLITNLEAEQTITIDETLLANVAKQIVTQDTINKLLEGLV